MARLFARLNGGRGGAPPAEPAPKPTAATVAEPLSAAPTAAVPTAPAPLPVDNSRTPEGDLTLVADREPLTPLTMLPRRAAPERQADLSAMRQLANMTASSAIGASQRRRWTSSGTVKLAAAAALGIFGIAVLLLATSGWAGSSQAAVFGFGAVLFVAGAVWLLQGMGLLMMAWRVGRHALHIEEANEPAKSDGAETKE